MTDILENIKRKHLTATSQSDIGWLIAEVERLRETVAVLYDPETMRAIAEGEKDV